MLWSLGQQQFEIAAVNGLCVSYRGNPNGNIEPEILDYLPEDLDRALRGATFRLTAVTDPGDEGLPIGHFQTITGQRQLIGLDRIASPPTQTRRWWQIWRHGTPRSRHG